MTVGIIWQKPVLTYASIIFAGMLASVNLVNQRFKVRSAFYKIRGAKVNQPNRISQSRSAITYCHRISSAISSAQWTVAIRACLDQVLIAIRSFTLHCDHNRSKTRLITIMNLIAKLAIIYAMHAMPASAQPRWTV